MMKKEYPQAWVYKPQDLCRSGIPDLIICLFGFFCAIELKVSGNKTTPIQDYTLSKIKSAGGITTVCYSADEVKEILQLMVQIKIKGGE